MTRLLNFFGLVLGVGICIELNAAPLCVSTDGAALRRGPGTRWLKLFEMRRFTPLVRIAPGAVEPKLSDLPASAVDWVSVRDYDKETGWVSEKLVDRSFRCGLVNVNDQLVRTKAAFTDAQTEMMFVAKYTPFKVIAQRKDWVQAEFATGITRWIPRSVTWIP